MIAAGTRLGPYEIDSPLGAGGMGEVYKARDTRLGRTVAVKVLPAHLAADPDRRRRFEQEARAASALNHPNICVLHDIGSADGTDYLVMEYLQGQTLAERLHGGRAGGSTPLPVKEAIEYGIQIADALAKAHRHGIVHRDLKPGNVMLTRGAGSTQAKLLDFGLAKLRPAPTSVGAATAVSALQTQEPATLQGTILGTVPYMAPEQIDGKEADARSDIFALGAVLYEMLSGRRAFEGESQASLIAAVMDRTPPPLPSLQPRIPPALDRLVTRCLAKDADDRCDSAHEVADQLRFILDTADSVRKGGVNGAAPASVSPGRHLAAAAWPLVGLLALAAAGFVWWQRASGVDNGSPQRLHISLSASGLALAESGLAISPDGQTVVFSARGAAGQSQLYTRRLDEFEPRPLAGTENGSNPFFSPDGQWIAFCVMGKGLGKVPVRGGGAPQFICEFTGQAIGGFWGPDDRIVFGGYWPSTTSGLWAAPANGGALQRVGPPISGRPSLAYLWPQMLPGGKAILFTRYEAGQPSVCVLSLADKHEKTLIDRASNGRYVQTGHLLYELDGELHAIAFDPDALQCRGSSRVMVEGIATAVDRANYDVSATGTLVYQSASALLARLAWKDRSGQTAPLKLLPRLYRQARLSPDGRRLAVTVTEGGASNIWLGSVDGEPLRKLTFGDDEDMPLFSPDGRWVLFTSGGSQRYNIFRLPADASGNPERVTDTPYGERATSWTPDGKTLLTNEWTPSGFDVAQDDVQHPAFRRQVLNSRFNELEAAISPDGRWMAYESDEAGRMDVYVQAYPGPGRKNQISIDGGLAPAWTRHGDELVYQGPTSVMAMTMADGQPVGQPVSLFPHARSFTWGRDWDVTADGMRFLMVESAGGQLNVVSRWFADLKAVDGARTP